MCVCIKYIWLKLQLQYEYTYTSVSEIIERLNINLFNSFLNDARLEQKILHKEREVAKRGETKQI